MKNTIHQTISSRVIIYLPLLIALLAILLLCYLGMWQLNRGFEKNTLKTKVMSQQTLSILSEHNLKTAHNHELNYRKINLQGVFLNQYTLLLDNQINNGTAGYHVLVPFEWQKNQWILVNQGWIKAPSQRHDLPIIIPNIECNLLTGTLRLPSNNKMIKRMLETDHITWPLRIQKIDLHALQNIIPGTATPYLLYLESAPLPETWLTPERHFGYAVQWFLLALALSIIVICVAKRT